MSIVRRIAVVFIFFFKHMTAYEMRISDWSSDVCSSDLHLCQRFSGVCALGTKGSALRTRVSQLMLLPCVRRGSRPRVLLHRRERGQAHPRRGARSDRRSPSRRRRRRRRGRSPPPDRKSGVEGKGGSVRVDHGGRRTIKKKNNNKDQRKKK